MYKELLLITYLKKEKYILLAKEELIGKNK